MLSHLIKKLKNFSFFYLTRVTRTQTILQSSSLGKYLDKVDRVMTQVDNITEDIGHMPLAAFIFRVKEIEEVHYSSDIRYPL